MTDKHLLDLCDLYEEKLKDRLPPLRHAHPQFAFEFEQHVRWMLPEMRQFVAAGRREKAMRWLGFVQGVLCMIGHYSLDDLRRQSAPPEEVFDAQRV